MRFVALLAAAMFIPGTVVGKELAPGSFVCRYNKVCDQDNKCRNDEKVLEVEATFFLAWVCGSTEFGCDRYLGRGTPFFGSFDATENEIFAFAQDKPLSFITITTTSIFKSETQIVTIRASGEDTLMVIEPVSQTINVYQGTCEPGRCGIKVVDGQVVRNCEEIR